MKIPPFGDALLDLLAVWDPVLGYPILYALYSVYGESESQIYLRPQRGQSYGVPVPHHKLAE